MLLPPTAEMPKLPLIFIAMDPADCSESSILCLTGQPPQVCLPTVEFYQITNIRWIIEKARQFQKNIYFCFIDYAKAFDCVDHSKLWKILKEMGIPDHLTCLLKNLYAGQEATVRTGHGTTDWFQIGKGVSHAVYCHPAYLTYMQSTS